MSRREKLREKMTDTPHKIRFAEVESLLRSEGFILFNSRGSHRTYHRADGTVLTVVVPHGRRKTCNPADVRRILGALEP
jgi:predicted RNA binding protein YcfA (HicA-like mRNA interferase family)